MTTATHVPTNGFNAPPGGPAPTPSVPNPGGFNVPPAGDPPRLPQAPNGNPVALPGQVPGMVPHGQPQPQPGQQPQPNAQTPDMASLLASMQAILSQGQNGPAALTAAPGDATRPAWLGTSANEFDVRSIDDPIIRSMASVLQVAAKDVDLDRVIGKALAFGDASLIDRAYLAEKGGAAAPQIAELAKNIVDAVNAKSNAITNSVYESVGGEQNWQASVAAFNQQAPKELRAVVANMLDSTNEAHIRAGAKFVAEFGRQSGLIPQQGAPLLGGNASAGVQGHGLSKEQFQAELRKLNRDDRGYEQAREALMARRALGKRSGL